MPRALIIDDQEITRNAVRLLLEKINFDLDEAENGYDGIQAIKKHKYDLVFLDIRMPVLDGEQVITILKKRNDACPIIVISAYLREEQIVRLIKLGIKGFISKPFDLQKFYQEVNKFYPIQMPE